jgi:hypothetical protein
LAPLALVPAGGGTVEQEFPLALIAREASRALELGAGLAEPAELLQEMPRTLGSK